MTTTAVIADSTLQAVTSAVKSIYADTWKGEQKDMEEVTVSYPAEKLMTQDLNDSEDADYDPQEDEAQGTKDQEEDVESGVTEEEELVESELEVELSLDDEQAIVDSEEFETAWFEAIDHIKGIAQYHREQLSSFLKEEYFEETGEEASDDMVQDAFTIFQIDDQDEVEVESSEEELADVDPATFEAEFEEALEVVRDLAEVHQEELVHSICNTSQELTGKEPDVEQLAEIFDRIKVEFAEEAREEFLDTYCVSENDQDSESDDDEADSDYSPETDPFDYTKDAEEDQFLSTDDDDEEEEEEDSA